MEINATGTQLRFKPGVLLGGEIEHECPVGRSVGWFLEGIMPLAPFGKEDLELTLEGTTDSLSHVDPSPDYLSKSILPLFIKFGIGADAEEGLPPSIQILQRGAAPMGGGKVLFTCPIIKEIAHPLDYTDVGKIKRVRGTVVSCRIPPSSAARVAHSAKGLLHRLLPDVWIHTDAHSSSRKGREHGCGPSPGLSVCLTAESHTDVVIAAETCMDPEKDGRGALLPEDLGVRCAAMLLDEIRKGGCIDSGAQSIAFLLMCLGPEDVSRIRVGTLTQYSIVTLRLLKKAFGVEFKVRADKESKTVFLSCLGSGYRNMARAST